MNLNTTKKLNNGVEIPLLGLGVFKSGKDTYKSVRYALDAGYRHIDTASYYQNEYDVGKAVKDSGIAREDIFITTKIWTDDMRNHKVREAFEESLRLLNCHYVDLYLIHWPVKEEYIKTYQIMEKLNQEGKIKAIGVSNFQPHHLDTLIDNVETKPAVNQIEIHPYLNNNEVIKYCFEKGIAPQSWSPLARARIMNDSKLLDMATKYNKTVAQIAIRWHLQKNLIVIPKSIHKERIVENTEVFDFQLSLNDMNIIEDLDCNLRTGSHPDSFNF